MEDVLDEIPEAIKIKYKKNFRIPYTKDILGTRWYEYVEKDYFMLKINNKAPIFSVENQHYMLLASFIFVIIITSMVLDELIQLVLNSTLLFILGSYLIIYTLILLFKPKLSFKEIYKDGCLNFFYSFKENLLMIHKDEIPVLKVNVDLSDIESFFVTKSPSVHPKSDDQNIPYGLSMHHLCVRLNKEHDLLKPVEGGYKLLHLYEVEKNRSGDLTRVYGAEHLELNRKKMETLALYLNQLLKTSKAALYDINPNLIR